MSLPAVSAATSSKSGVQLGVVLLLTHIMFSLNGAFFFAFSDADVVIVYLWFEYY